jgi:hypothetical protein
MTRYYVRRGARVVEGARLESVHLTTPLLRFLSKRCHCRCYSPSLPS